MEDHRQQTELLRQQNQVLIQQVTNLTLSVNSLTQVDYNDDSDVDDKNINTYLAHTFGNGAVEESKEIDHPEDQPSSISSSLSGDTLITPCAAASISTYIRCTNGEASTDHAATQPTPAAPFIRAEEAREASADNQVVAQPSPTDVEMNDYYNKHCASPPTETNNISALVQLKKSKNVSINTGQAIMKAAQKRS